MPAGRMPQFTQGLGFNLPYAFASNAVLFADLLQCALIAIHQTIAQFQNLALAFIQAIEDFSELASEQIEAGDFARIIGRFILEEISEVRLVSVAERRLHGDRLLRHSQYCPDPLD